MLRWFHALMPKEERFFELFARHSQAVLAGAQALRAMMEGGEAISTNCETVMDREHDADNATREGLIAVHRTFITPFDRGSIRDLITAMDNSIDQMHKTAKAVTLFEQRAFQPEMVRMGDIIVSLAGVATNALSAFTVVATWFRRFRGRALLLLTFVAGFASTIFMPTEAKRSSSRASSTRTSSRSTSACR